MPPEVADALDQAGAALEAMGEQRPVLIRIKAVRKGIPTTVEEVVPQAAVTETLADRAASVDPVTTEVEGANVETPVYEVDQEDDEDLPTLLRQAAARLEKKEKSSDEDDDGDPAPSDEVKTKASSKPDMVSCPNGDCTGHFPEGTGKCPSCKSKITWDGSKASLKNKSVTDVYHVKEMDDVVDQALDDATYGAISSIVYGWLRETFGAGDWYSSYSVDPDGIDPGVFQSSTASLKSALDAAYSRLYEIDEVAETVEKAVSFFRAGDEMLAIQSAVQIALEEKGIDTKSGKVLSASNVAKLETIRQTVNDLLGIKDEEEKEGETEKKRISPVQRKALEMAKGLGATMDGGKPPEASNQPKIEGQGAGPAPSEGNSPPDAEAGKVAEKGINLDGMDGEEDAVLQRLRSELGVVKGATAEDVLKAYHEKLRGGGKQDKSVKRRREFLPDPVATAQRRVAGKGVTRFKGSRGAPSIYEIARED